MAPQLEIVKNMFLPGTEYIPAHLNPYNNVSDSILKIEEGDTFEYNVSGDIIVNTHGRKTAYMTIIYHLKNNIRWL